MTRGFCISGCHENSQTQKQPLQYLSHPPSRKAADFFVKLFDPDHMLKPLSGAFLGLAAFFGLAAFAGW